MGRVTKGTACHGSWEGAEARPQRLQQRARYRAGKGDRSARAPVAKRDGPGMESLHGARGVCRELCFGRRRDLCFGRLGVGVCGKDGPLDEEAVITAEVLDIKEGGQSDWASSFLFGLTVRYAGSLFPDQVSNPRPLRWQCGVLTAGSP